MKYVVIDLEMNPISKFYKAERSITRNEIIQIGAIILNDDYMEIGSFETFVKPQFNIRIEKKIETLTGISTSMIESAPNFEQALKKFLEWCWSYPDELQILQWSDSDYEQITKEMKLKHYILSDYEKKLYSDWIDFQKEFNNFLGLNRRISLSNALMYAGIEFEGNQHDALFDARNTGCLLRTVRIPELCGNALKDVIDALSDKPLNNSLGSMFDFSQIQLTA